MIFMSACTADEVIRSKATETEQEDDRTQYILSFGLSMPGQSMAATRAAERADEYSLQSMQILFFDSDGKFVMKANGVSFQKTAESPGAIHDSENTNVNPSDTIDAEYTVTAELDEALDFSSKVVFLANADNVSAVRNETYESVLGRAVYMASWDNGGTTVYGFPHSAGTYFPMSGTVGPRIFTGIRTDDAITYDIGTVLMSRSLARVDLGINFLESDLDNDKDDPTAQGLENFRMTSLRVYYGLDRGYVGELNGTPDLESSGLGSNLSIPESATYYPLDGSVYPNVLYEQPYGTTGEYDAGAQKSIREIYLPETKNHNDDGTPKNLTKRCCLVVGGKYYHLGKDMTEDEKNNFDWSTVDWSTVPEQFYRVDFETEDEDPIDIVRNRRYLIDIVGVEGPGVDIPDTAVTHRIVEMDLKVEHWDEAFNYTLNSDVHMFRTSVETLGNKFTSNYLFMWEDTMEWIENAYELNGASVSLPFEAGAETKVEFSTDVNPNDWQEMTEYQLFYHNADLDTVISVPLLHSMFYEINTVVESGPDADGYYNGYISFKNRYEGGVNAILASGDTAKISSLLNSLESYFPDISTIFSSSTLTPSQEAEYECFKIAMSLSGTYVFSADGLTVSIAGIQDTGVKLKAKNVYLKDWVYEHLTDVDYSDDDIVSR